MNQPPTTFKDANDWFYRTFDLNKLTFGDVNYTKIVQKAMHDGWMQGIETTYGLKDAKIAILKSRLQHIRIQRPSKRSRPIGVLYFDSSRRFISRDGANESFYGERWFEIWEKENIDFKVVPEIAPNLRLAGHLLEELKLLNALVAQCKQLLGSSHAFLPHLEAICFNYLISYGAASDVIRRFRPDVIVLTCHYGKEGLIRAARQNGVKVYEIQHGIIDENDIFYCYPKEIRGVRKLALFPDSIYTYGNYWSDLLSQYHEFDRIVTAGDYTFRTPSQTKERQNRVLITTQTGMFADYLQIITWIANQVAQNPEWKIVVRHHPLENNTTLSRYRDLCNNFPFISESVGTSLSEDFQESKVHVSIYSTTLFDACRWPLHNYSVQNFGSASTYAASILDTGIAEGIELGEPLPLHRLAMEKESESCSEKSNYFYSEFPTPTILNELSKWSA